MRSNHGRPSLKHLLDLGQRMVPSVNRDGASRGTRSRHHSRRRDARRRLLEACAARRLPDPLQSLREQHALDPLDIALLVRLLDQRAASADPEMDGRTLLLPFCDTTFELLTEAARLSHDSRLVKQGLVRSRVGHPDEVLEGQFRLAEGIYRRVLVQLRPRRPEEPRRDRPFSSPLEHLAAARHFGTLCERRAAILFPQSYWAEIHPDEARSGDLESLRTSIDQARAEMRQREAQSGGPRLPMVELRREFHLSDDEETILWCLLFLELYAASPLIEGSELVRVVSPDAEAVLSKRSLLADGSPLRELSLISLDQEVEDKPVIANVYLPEWTTARLLRGLEGVTGNQREAGEGEADAPQIGTEDCTRFRDFLEGLESSEEFFRNLG